MNRRSGPGRGPGTDAEERRVRGRRVDGNDRLPDVALHGRGSVQSEEAGEISAKNGSGSLNPGASD